MVSKKNMSLFPIINQKDILTLIHNVVKNQRIANAYLLFGEDGSGTEAIALEFAALVNCTGDQERPCGHCSACKAMHKLEHPNLTLIFPIPIRTDEASDNPLDKLREDEIEELHQAIARKAANPYAKITLKKGLHIPINSIRAVSSSAYLTPAVPGQKMVLIFDAHQMTEQAANAFLKILEEPPAFTTFILTTSQVNQILPTIRSRCQTLYVPPIPPNELEAYLAAKSDKPSDVRLAAHLAAGDILTAEQLLDSNLAEIKTMTQSIMEALINGDIKAVYQLTNSLSQIGRENPDLFKLIIRALLFWIRDLQAVHNEVASDNLIYQEYAELLSAYTKKLPHLNYHQMKAAVENCIDFLNRNVYINLAVLEMFFNLRDCIKSGIKDEL